MKIISTVPTEHCDLRVRYGKVEVPGAQPSDPSQTVSMVDVEMIDNENPARASVGHIEMRLDAVSELMAALGLCLDLDV